MGRVKIKKKETVIPFRQTLAFRMMVLAFSMLIFVYTVYEMYMAWTVNNTLAFIIAFLLAFACSLWVFYNLDHLRDAKVPKRTLDKMKRR